MAASGPDPAGRSLVLPLVKGWLYRLCLLLVPVLAFGAVLVMPQGEFGVVPFLEWDLIFGRVDRLSRVFAYIMTLMGIIGTLYSLHVGNPFEMSAAWIYVAGAWG